MKTLLASSLPPIEMLSPDGAGASLDSDMEIEPASASKGNGGSKNVGNNKGPSQGKMTTMGVCGICC